MPMYQQKTRSIEISVEPFYVDEQSSPSSNRFVFGYRVKIDNQGIEAVQLINRYWQITDALGRTVEVEGPGVVGEQPLIEPGDHFEYTSGTPLATPSGVMIGRYQMVTESGETFDAKIPAFSLDAPGAQMCMN
jgi:ApaG protein